MEGEPKVEFDLDRFKGELTEKTEEYATNAYITYGRDTSLELNRQKEARRDALYPELVADCAQALDKAPDKEAVLLVIEEVLIKYRYGAGADLFGGNSRMQFYRDLLLASLNTNPTEEGQ